MEKERDRALGAFLGLAVGDALGTTLEFVPRDRHPHHTEITGGGPFHLLAGQWTDDTSMALALADSLLEVGEYDPNDVMRKYVSWWKEGRYSSTGECFDIGTTTRGALDMFLAVGRPEIGSHSPDTAGNGSIMRLAPAVICALPSEEAAISLAVRQSKTTHGAIECLEACDYLGRQLSALILGHDLGDRRGVYSSPGMTRIAARDWTGKSREMIKSTGYVIDTLEAALWADANASSFEEALILAVNLGGDADTIGAVTGQIAGARYGLSGIPQKWLDVLHDGSKLIDVATRLHNAHVTVETEREGFFSRLMRSR